ncbi:MAG: DUF1540 domain-containing protein [Pseudomonadota bacterium]
MGMVLACQVEECSYNQGRVCRAGGIMVGDRGTHAACDTFTTEPAEQKLAEPMVSDCEVSVCRFNDEAGVCHAPAVSLGRHEGHAECDSYIPES